MAEQAEYRVPKVFLMDEDDGGAEPGLLLAALLGKLHAELHRIPEHERNNARVCLRSPGTGALLVLEDKRGE